MKSKDGKCLLCKSRPIISLSYWICKMCYEHLNYSCQYSDNQKHLPKDDTFKIDFVYFIESAAGFSITSIRVCLFCGENYRDAFDHIVDIFNMSE